MRRMDAVAVSVRLVSYIRSEIPHKVTKAIEANGDKIRATISISTRVDVLPFPSRLAMTGWVDFDAVLV